jgi:hypothetical protein
MYSLVRAHIDDLRRTANAGLRTAGSRAAIRTRAGSTLIQIGQRLLDGPAQQ